MIEPSVSTGRAFYRGLLDALAQVMGGVRGYPSAHGPRVASLAHQIAARLGLEERERAELIYAAILSDLGMIGLAEEAWDDPTPMLDERTRNVVERHPVRSESLLPVPQLGPLASLVRHHHEWWDGSGYPDGLAGDAIPEGARILRLADTVCALGEDRTHRRAFGPRDVTDTVRRFKGVEFCPDIAEAYLGMAGRGEVETFRPGGHHRTLRDATDALLPDDVSPLSPDQLLGIMAGLIDAKDPYTGGHSRRVAVLALAVADRLGLDEGVRSTVWAAGYLHDLGKLAVPLRILTKGSRLEDAELVEVRSHPVRGATILDRIPALRHLTAGTRYHHEKWDGSGYPEGLRGDHIPLVAQILAVCDAYDAMTSERAYRSSRTHPEALDEIAAGTGTHFGPGVTAAFLSLPDPLFSAVRALRPHAHDAGHRPRRGAGSGMRHPGAAARA